MPLRLFGPRYWPTWLGLGCLRLFAALPYPLMVRTGRLIGWISRHLPLNYGRVARRNLELCLPELSVREREVILDRNFQCMGVGLCESAMTWWSSDERIRDLSRVEGLEHLERALALGHGVILLTAHFTTLEISARILNAVHPICALYRPPKNALLAAISARHRGRLASRMILRDDVRGMVRALKHNECVWYAPDQSYRKKGAVMVPFFGIPAPTNVFTSRLAEITGAAVLPYSHERLPDGAGYRAVIHPPLEHHAGDDALTDALRFHHFIEEQVQRIPEQYLWIHRRFKGLSQTDPEYYGRAARKSVPQVQAAR
jgi:KDO2-lipid IV(A) lauroyltransferase